MKRRPINDPTEGRLIRLRRPRQLYNTSIANLTDNSFSITHKTQMRSTASSISPGEEPSELERFRQEWLAELQSRKAAPEASGQSITRNDAWEVNSPRQISSKAAVEAPEILAALPKAIGPSSQVIAGSYTPSVHLAATPLPQKLGSALNVYRRAVESEQNGDLDDALLLYRQAFRMVCLLFNSSKHAYIFCRTRT